MGEELPRHAYVDYLQSLGIKTEGVDIQKLTHFAEENICGKIGFLGSKKNSVEDEMPVEKSQNCQYHGSKQ
jgi:hypothetical protein